MMNRKFIYLILTFTIFIVIPSAVRSDEFKLIPSVTALEEYNSNVFFGYDNIKSDFVTTLSPAFELVNRTERSNANVKIRFDHNHYANNRDLNATDQLYQGKFGYNITPRFGISADAGYIRDSRPDRDIETTGLVSSALRRERINAAFSTDYQVTELTAFLFSYAYGKETYEKEDHSDILTHDINAGLTHDLNKYVPALKGDLNLGYSNFDFSDTQMDVIMGTIGVSQDINELWSARIDAGLRYAHTEFLESRLEPVLPPFLYKWVVYEETEDGWGWLGKAFLNYSGERGSGKLTFSRDVRPSSSGYSNAVTRDALTLSTGFRMTYELSAVLYAGYFTNKSDQFEFSTDIIDTKSYYISPGISYKISKDIFVKSSYNYTKYYNKVADTEADRHLFSIRLYIQHPLLE
ncbi:MAG: outer membrane beta-barrel protein [Pseudomonadota bacterium]